MFLFLAAYGRVEIPRIVGMYCRCISATIVHVQVTRDDVTEVGYNRCPIMLAVGTSFKANIV